jgi:hypothetical protein
MAIFRRITENGDLRITELGDERHLENSSPDINTPFIPPSGYGEDIKARLNVINPNDLTAELYVTQTPGETAIALGGQLAVPTTVTVPQPTFSWYNSEEFDSDPVTYQIEFAIEGDWGGTGSFTESSIPESVGDKTCHTITNSLTADIVYSWRVRAYDGYEYGPWSQTLYVIYVVSTQIVSDVFAKILIEKPGQQDLSGLITIIQDGFSDLGAKIATVSTEDLGATIRLFANEDLPAKLNISAAVDLDAKLQIPTNEDLGATITPMVTGDHDLGGSLDVIVTNADIGAKIKIVTYVTKNVLAKIAIFSIDDLPASCYIIPYVDLNSSLIVSRLLGAKIFVPARSDLDGYIDIFDYAHYDLPASGRIFHAADISGKITIGEYENLDGRLNVTIEHQSLDAEIDIKILDDSDLSGSLNVTVEHQELKAEALVIASGNANLGGQLTNISTLQHLDSEITISLPDFSDLNSQIEAIENVPDKVCPSGYVIPSGYPNAPTFTTEWLDPSGIAVPPSGAAIVPEGVWQQEEEILFVWPEPSDWGYDASPAGYTVAWNDEENYIVSDSDQFVVNNYIEKSWFDSGSRWFHLRARNSHGHLGPQCSYNVLINQLPSETGPDHYVNFPPNPSGISNTSRPIFYWDKATDEDQLDTISYQLQIEPSGIFTDGTPSSYLISDIPQTQAGTVNEYDFDIEDLVKGNYEWRVRAYDSKQFGPWSAWQPLSLVPYIEELGAKITLSVPWLVNFQASIEIIQYEDLPSSILVVPRSELGGKITLVSFEDLDGQIFLPPGSNLNGSALIEVIGDDDLDVSVDVFHASDIGGQINIPPFGNLQGLIDVDTDHQEIMGEINVVVPSGVDLEATAFIKGDLKGEITVNLPASGNLPASATVVQDGLLDLGASIYVIDYEDLYGKMFVPGRSFLDATADVQEDIPDDVVVTSDVPESTWQTNNAPNFYWTEPYDPFSSVEEYYIAFNQDPNYEVSDSDQRTNALTDDRFIFDAGEYYFHIRARNLFGNWSANTTHYGVWFNNPPGAVGEPLQVEGLVQPVIGTTQPEFSWESAIDPDQLDVLTYHLQISTTFDFSNVISDILNVPQTGNSSRTEYFLESQYALPGEGQYFWRVRASDGREFGPWSNTTGFTVIPITDDFGAKLTIPVESYEKLGASVYVVPYKELDATIAVSIDLNEDLGATLSVAYKIDTELQAIARIASRSFLDAKINIVQYKDLPSSINIFGVRGELDMGAKVELNFYGDFEVGSKINVATADYSEFIGYIGIIPYNDNLTGYITTFHDDFFSWIDDFNRHIGASVTITASGDKYLLGSITTIADRPGPVIIHANVEEATWQTESLIQFTWDPAAPGFSPVTEYHTVLDQDPNTIVGDQHQNTIGFFRDFNLENENGSGIYYFHVAAKNAVNKYGPTTHYAVYYNRIPSIPTIPMLVNNIDTLANFPIIGATIDLNFEWGQSYDDDELDAISYHLQIATEPDFGLTPLNTSSIIHEQHNIPSYTHIINSETFVPSGTYYWRVRAYDGKQYSLGWSPVGHFTVNTPPLPPTNLLVYRA